MPDLADFVKANAGDAVISYAGGTVGTPGAYDAIGCPKNDWTFARSRDEVNDDIDNWCIQAGDSTVIDSFTPGPLNLTIDGDMELILDDAAYLAIIAAMEGADLGFFKRDLTNVGDTQTQTLEWGGYLTNVTENIRGQGTSDVSVSFRANEIVAQS